MFMLVVLLWKCYLVRKRTLVSTVVEFLFPFLIFLLMFSVRDIIFHVVNSPPSSFSAEETERLTEPLRLDRRLSVQRILYYPDSEPAAQLMDLVGKQLHLPHLKNLPDHKTRGIYGLPNLSIIDTRAEFMKNNMEAVVIFQDMTHDMPKKLNYTIRIKTNFMTNRYKSLDMGDGDFGPHEGFGSIYEPFLRLQWAVDSSYIRLHSNATPQTVWIQEFPYVQSKANPNAEIVGDMSQFVIWLALLLPYVFFVSRLIAERASGTLELVKMVGVPWSSLTLSNFLNMAPTGLLFSIGAVFFMTTSNTPILQFTNRAVLFIYLLLHFTSHLAFGLLVSFLVYSSRYSGTVSFVSYLCISTTSKGIMTHIPKAFHLIFSIWPYLPCSWFWTQVTAIEARGENVSTENFFKSYSSDSYSMFLCMLFLVLQIVLYFLIAWYLGQVCPGAHGVAKPAYFLFQKSYWSKQVSPDLKEEHELEEPIVINQKYFEPAPPDADVGIKIINVAKMFPGHKALNNVNLDVYKGETTVLLGHNGAGKTTLMSIITGIISASAGTVLVNGHDISKQRATARKHLGLCPQHNVYFPYLTVLEHVMFFTMLKGGSCSQAESSSISLLRRVGLNDKLNSRVSQLSGGMMRRSQLACALAGNASVLILDEPTSGLDVETRRELWDLILSLRGSHTVLLSTHFMEEADVLAERVVALHAGRVRCNASSMHLKRAIGTGYRLNFTTIGAPQEAAITQCIQSIVPEATMKELLPNSITYNLPANSSTSFSQLFSTLESRRSELAINSIGVGVSTLEEVFLQLCSDTETSFSSDELDGVPPPASSVPKLTGCKLYMRQLCALLKRHLLYLYSTKYSFCVMHVLVPIIALIVITLYCNNGDDDDTYSNPAVPMDLRVYGNEPDAKVLHADNLRDQLLRMRDKYPRVQFNASQDVIEDVLVAGHSNLSEYNKYLVGIELNKTDAKISYTTIYRHTAPVALNLLSNAMAPSVGNSSNTIVTYNHPILSAVKHDDKTEPKDKIIGLMWCTFGLLIVLSAVSSAPVLPAQERNAGSRHIHLMSGCPALIYWGTTFTFHAMLYTSILVLPMCCIAYVADYDDTFQNAEFIACLAVVLILGIMSFLSFAYFASFYFGEAVLGGVLITVIILFGIITPSVYATWASITPNYPWYISLVNIFRYVIPTHAFFNALTGAVNTARENFVCKLIPDCSAGGNLGCYFCLKKDAPGSDILIMLLLTFGYMSLVLLKEYGILSKCFELIVNYCYVPPQHRFNDTQVSDERVYVDKAFRLPREQIKESMLVWNLHKVYSACFSNKVNAVKGISFSVNKGECFGLLGVNGAGKSTVFKMITAEEVATVGSIYSNGSYCGRTGPYLQSLGYCPQFLGLDGFLTGKQNLHLVLTLRGLPPDEVNKQTDTWIQIVGLEKYASRRISSYSGGMKRRIGTAAALCGGATVALLDEPTAGVDVAARRRVWAAVRHAQRENRAVIITSHSMDEMEALCSRIAIMNAGEMCALGSAAALKSKHAKGHSLILKLNTATTMSAEEFKAQIVTLKEQLHKTFIGKLVDEHKSMIQFHIDNTMQYSVLFEQLEQIKRSFAIIEDYSVTETTLEEVFLSFAKEAPNSATGWPV